MNSTRLVCAVFTAAMAFALPPRLAQADATITFVEEYRGPGEPIYSVSVFPTTPNKTLVAPDGTQFRLQTAGQRVEAATFAELDARFFGTWSYTDTGPNPDVVANFVVAPFTLDDVYDVRPIIRRPPSDVIAQGPLVIAWDYEDGTNSTGKAFRQRDSENVTITQTPGNWFGMEGGLNTYELQNVAITQPGLPASLTVGVGSFEPLPEDQITLVPVGGVIPNIRLRANWNSVAIVTYAVVPEPATGAAICSLLLVGACLRRYRSPTRLCARHARVHFASCQSRA